VCAAVAPFASPDQQRPRARRALADLHHVVAQIFRRIGAAEDSTLWNPDSSPLRKHNPKTTDGLRADKVNIDWIIVVVAGTALLAAAAWALLRLRSTPDERELPAEPQLEPEDPIKLDLPTDRASQLRRLQRLHWMLLLEHGPSAVVTTEQRREVLIRVGQIVRMAPLDPRYFPRRPEVIPRLLRSMRNNDSNKRELVDLLLQDAGLTGKVIKLANSVIYRRGDNSVETVGQALTLLGHDGLRSLISASLLTPTFDTRGNSYPDLARRAWNTALVCASMSQVYARRTHDCDSFSAHLCVLIGAIGQIAVFRMTLDACAQLSVRPDTSLLVESQMRHTLHAVLNLCKDWELSTELTAAALGRSRQRHAGADAALNQAVQVGWTVGLAAACAGQVGSRVRENGMTDLCDELEKALLTQAREALGT